MTDGDTLRAIERALALPDVAAAAALAERALAAGQDDPVILNLVAWRREQAGDHAAAGVLLNQALKISPQDHRIITSIGILLRKEDRIDDAVASFDKAISIDPGHALAWHERGVALELGGAMRPAAESYRRAAELDPGFAQPLAGLASVAGRLGRPAAVREFAGRALAIDPYQSTAICTLAAADIEEGAYARAKSGVETILERDGLTADNRQVALSLLGDACDGLGQPAEAFDAYSRANAAFAALHAARFGVGGSVEPHLKLVERIASGFDAVDPAAWLPKPARVVAGGARTHVFVLGYPRSGTTLVETMLATAPRVEVLEERPTLAEADREFLLDDDGMERLARLDDGDIARLRAAYWRQVAGHGIKVPGKVFVDMSPLNGIKLPIISRLFPEARIIVLERDPRDVVWSCFRRNFRVNAATYEFTGIERTARHFDAVMRLMDRFLQDLPVKVHIVRYADLVTDFDTVTKAICDFAQVPWSPGLRDFGRTARSRAVTTASAAQIRRGLFNGVGQWQPYADYLEPVLPILQPWIDRLERSVDMRRDGDNPAAIAHNRARPTQETR